MMDCYKDLRGALITNIVSAAGAISQMRLQLRGTPIIIGGLATGVLIYCGHRWLSAAGSASKPTKTDAAEGAEKQQEQEQQ